MFSQRTVRSGLFVGSLIIVMVLGLCARMFHNFEPITPVRNFGELHELPPDQQYMVIDREELTQNLAAHQRLLDAYRDLKAARIRGVKGQAALPYWDAVIEAQREVIHTESRISSYIKANTPAEIRTVQLAREQCKLLGQEMYKIQAAREQEAKK